MNLSGATLRGANLRGASLCKADLRGADLRGTQLIGTGLSHADLTGSAAWDVKLDSRTRQGNLIVTPPDQPAVMVDNIKVAQFSG